MKDGSQMYREVDVTINAEYDVPFYGHAFSDQHYPIALLLEKYLMQAGEAINQADIEGFSRHAEQHWIDTWQESFEKGESYAILLGDMMEDFRFSTRTNIRAVVPEGEGKSIQYIGQLAGLCLKERLGFLTDRIWTIVSGNHNMFVSENKTLDMYLAELFHAPFGGGFCSLIIRVKLPDGKSFDIHGVCQHGRGGNYVRIGSNLNKAEDIMSNWGGLHFVAMAHTHKPAFAPKITNTRQFGKTTKSACTQLIRGASWRTNYRDGREDYAVGLSPTCLDIPRIKFTPRKHGKEVYFEMEYQMSNKMRCGNAR